MEVLILILGIIGLRYLVQRLIVGSAYTWLETLHHTEWKNEAELVLEMQKLKKVGVVFDFVFRSDLKKLIAESLVEVNIQIPIETSSFAEAVFRLTQSGSKKRYDRPQEKQSFRSKLLPTE